MADHTGQELCHLLCPRTLTSSSPGLNPDLRATKMVQRKMDLTRAAHAGCLVSDTALGCLKEGVSIPRVGMAAGPTVCYCANTDTVLDLVLHQTPALSSSPEKWFKAWLKKDRKQEKAFLFWRTRTKEATISNYWLSPSASSWPAVHHPAHTQHSSPCRWEPLE